MNHISTFLKNSSLRVKQNAPEILTAVGVSGVVTTAYLSSKATLKANNVISWEPPDISNKEKVKLAWKFYIPAGVSGVVTIGCIIAAQKGAGRRTAAAVTAYSLTERAFSEYREKVVEQLGKGKEQKVRDAVAQDRIDKVGSSEIVILGSGDVLCCELHTNRFFKSDMETLRKAQNDINVKINGTLYVTLDEFYDLIGLGHTSNSNSVGWDGKLMELIFSTVLTPGGEPCLAFDYSYIKPLG